MGMQIKKFQAPSLQKAIETIRDELGDGAIILQADRIKGSGLLARNAVEVTAAIDRKEVPPRFEATVAKKDDERKFLAGKETHSSWKKMFRMPWQKQKNIEFPKVEEKKEVRKKIEKVVKQAVEKKDQSEPAHASAGQMYAIKSFIEPLKKEIEDLKNDMNSEKEKPAVQVRAPSNAIIETELQDLKKTIRNYIDEQHYEKSDLPVNLRMLFNFWKEKGMSTCQIYSFFHHLESEGLILDDSASENMIKPLLKRNISDAKTLESPKPRIVVLVGPTGVGKTTTIAKLAAFEKLKLGRKVALVTIDDYKIGGTDQLNHYARILDVPFMKSRSDLSLEEQCSHIDVDTLFIDTFGVSPKDDQKIMALKKALHLRNPVLNARQEIHLALPVGISTGDVEPYLAGFSRLHPNYLLFTKWDETENWGGMLATILSSQRPVSFVGNGQEVPDDLAVFSSDRFIEMVTSTQNF